MYKSEFKSKKCNFQHLLCGNTHETCIVFKSLRLFSYFADYSETIMFCNDLSIQPAECFRMRCPHVIEMGQLRSPEICNMASTIQKTNINNIKDDQNGRKKMIPIKHFKKQNFYPKIFSFSCFFVLLHVIHTL